MTNEELAKAVRAGDGFATAVVRRQLRPLASAVSALFTAIGVRRHLFIGGFALAVGPRFTELLGEELVALGHFGLSEDQNACRDARPGLRRRRPQPDRHGAALLDRRGGEAGPGEENDANPDRR